ncbi:MAG: GNAT family N-acetyltransferase [Pseudomonadota bacterium]
MKNNVDFELAIATIENYELIQNMARFYVYDLSKECGRVLSGWECPDNGLFECIDLKKYLTKPQYRSYLIKVNQEYAGFALVGVSKIFPDCHWCMEEFFVLGKFQRSGLGRKVATELFKRFSGRWAIGAIDENKRAINFWRTIISEYTVGKVEECNKSSDELRSAEQPDPYSMLFFLFDTDAHDQNERTEVRAAGLGDVDEMVALSEKKRRDYEKAQPIFWKHATDANSVQMAWFKTLLADKNHLVQVTECNGAMTGFIIGRLRQAPEVYAPGGLTLEVDDYCVSSDDLWWSVGRALLEQLCNMAKAQGAVQVVVVSGGHDVAKRNFLKSMGLTIASDWFTGPI